MFLKRAKSIKHLLKVRTQETLCANMSPFSCFLLMIKIKMRENCKCFKEEKLKLSKALCELLDIVL